MRKAITMLVALLCLVFTAVAAVGPTSNKPAVPDLYITDLKATDEQGVLYTVECDCNAPIPADTISVRIVIYGKDGIYKWAHSDVIHQEIAAKKPTNLTLNLLPNMSLLGTTFTLEIDSTGKIAETNELNNVSKKVQGFMKASSNINPKAFDLQLREAVYFGGKNQAKYVVKNQTLKLSINEAESCNGDACQFASGVYIMRTTGVEQALVVGLKVVHSVGGTIVADNTVDVKIDEQKLVNSIAFALWLRFGENRVKVEIDPANKIPEANENNNSFEVTVILEH